MKRREFFATSLAGAAIAALPVRRLWAEGAAGTAIPDADIAAIKLNGGSILIPKAAVADLRARLRGPLLVPGQEGYEQARRIWNHMIDRHPAVIARCAGPADVAAAVEFAREHELLLAVRGGGHSFPGYSSCDGGLVVDLSTMHGVRVDPIAKTVRAEGGCLARRCRWGIRSTTVCNATRRHFEHRSGGSHARKRLRVAQPAFWAGV